jgi:hypothetical protein
VACCDFRPEGGGSVRRMLRRFGLTT